MNWIPLITDSAGKEAILNKLQEFEKALSAKYLDDENIGVLSGSSGLSLFYSYLGQLQQTDKYQAYVERIISRQFLALNKGFAHTTHGNGIAGVLWSLHHQVSEGYMASEDFFEDIIPYLIRQMRSFADDAHFDFLHGANGIALYLLHFYERVDQEHFVEWVRTQKKKGITEDNTIRWESTVNYETGQRAYNLSLSHGIASTIILLTMLLEKQETHNETEELLNLCINYLLAQKFAPGRETLSKYPGYINMDGTPSETRLSWCYGDLGCAFALRRAGQLLKRQDLLDEANELMKFSSASRDIQAHKIFDAGICHGSAGLAHIFNRYYQQTGDEGCRKAALYWLEVTMGMDTFPDGLAGYKRYVPKEGWQEAHGLLDGIAGIGLVLISMISHTEPRWDRCLLLS